jgi:hypothetical protein
MRNIGSTNPLQSAEQQFFTSFKRIQVLAEFIAKLKFSDPDECKCLVLNRDVLK